jgi:hypothetical protein
MNIDFSSDLTLQHESEVPLLTLLGKLASERKKTNIFKFATGRFAPRTSLVANGEAAVAADNPMTLDVTAGTGVYFLAGDLLEFSGVTEDATHKNIAIVTAVNTDALTVYGYTDETSTSYGIPAITQGATVRRISSAMVEGSDGRASSQTIPNVTTQYCQVFEDYFDVTRIQAENRQYTGPERSRLRDESRKKHAVDQEYAAFLGRLGIELSNTTSTGKPRYMMAGSISLISSNVLTYGATLEDDELYDFMTDVHSPKYSGGNKRMVLASADLLASVNKLAKAAIRITVRDSTWGPNITTVQFAGRVWEFIEAPCLSESRDGWGVVMHPRYMKKGELIPTEYRMNVQTAIANYFKDGFESAWGLEQRLEEVFGIIKPS